VFHSVLPPLSIDSFLRWNTIEIFVLHPRLAELSNPLFLQKEGEKLIQANIKATAVAIRVRKLYNKGQVLKMKASKGIEISPGGLLSARSGNSFSWLPQEALGFR